MYRGFIVKYGFNTHYNKTARRLIPSSLDRTDWKVTGT